MSKRKKPGKRAAAPRHTLRRTLSHRRRRLQNDGSGGSEKGHKRSPGKGAIKMRMVGALVLKWSQKVNGMTHKRRSRRATFTVRRALVQLARRWIDLFVQEIFISFNTPSSYHSNAKSPVILFKSRLAIFTITIKDTHDAAVKPRQVLPLT